MLKCSLRNILFPCKIKLVYNWVYFLTLYGVGTAYSIKFLSTAHFQFLFPSLLSLSWLLLQACPTKKSADILPSPVRCRNTATSTVRNKIIRKELKKRLLITFISACATYFHISFTTIFDLAAFSSIFYLSQSMLKHQATITTRSRIPSKFF